MKIDNTVKKETLYIVLGETIFCILMLSVYLICGKFSLNVLIAALVGGSVSAMNFFLMGLTLQKAGKNRRRRKQSSPYSHLTYAETAFDCCYYNCMCCFSQARYYRSFYPALFPENNSFYQRNI